MKLKCSGRFRGLGAWKYAGMVGNGYSFGHAKYGASPKEKHLFRDQKICSIFCTAFCNFLESSAKLRGRDIEKI